MADPSVLTTTQALVVDLQPTSRFGLDHDIGYLTRYATLPMNIDLGEAARTIIQNAVGPIIGDGHFVQARVAETAPVRGEGGVFKLRLGEPPLVIPLVEGGDSVVTVLLPRAASYVDPTNQMPHWDGPHLVAGSVQPENKATIFDGSVLPKLGDRIAVVWHLDGDPDLDLEYVYEKMPTLP